MTSLSDSDDHPTRAAPPGKFRLVGISEFDTGDWVIGDFDSKEEAVNSVHFWTGLMYIYDDRGFAVARC